MAAVPPPGPIPAAAVAPGAGLNGQGPRNIFRDVSQHTVAYASERRSGSRKF